MVCFAANVVSLVAGMDAPRSRQWYVGLADCACGSSSEWVGLSCFPLLTSCTCFPSPLPSLSHRHSSLLFVFPSNPLSLSLAPVPSLTHSLPHSIPPSPHSLTPLSLTPLSFLPPLSLPPLYLPLPPSLSLPPLSLPPLYLPLPPSLSLPPLYLPLPPSLSLGACRKAYD